MQNTYQFSTNNTCLIFEERLYKQNLTIFELQFYSFIFTSHKGSKFEHTWCLPIIVINV